MAGGAACVAACGAVTAMPAASHPPLARSLILSRSATSLGILEVVRRYQARDAMKAVNSVGEGAAEPGDSAAAQGQENWGAYWF